jgi:hypothetical protein
VIAAAALPAAGAGGDTRAGAKAFQLVFDGHHTDALLHEGPFTSSLPFCASGQAADTAIDEQTLSATRVFTCAEGGTFTARVSPLPAEHTGTGRWQILAGTGPLSDLRGKGTFSGTLVSGSLQDPRDLTFRSTWTGAADLDAAPPRLAVLGLKVQRLSTPRNARRLTLSLSLKDANVVSYVLTVDDRRTPPTVLAARTGRTSNGALAVTLRVRPKIGTRYLRIDLAAEDAVGNDSSLRKVVRLR